MTRKPMSWYGRPAEDDPSKDPPSSTSTSGAPATSLPKCARLTGAIETYTPEDGVAATPDGGSNMATRNPMFRSNEPQRIARSTDASARRWGVGCVLSIGNDGASGRSEAEPADPGHHDMMPQLRERLADERCLTIRGASAENPVGRNRSRRTQQALGRPTAGQAR